MRLLFLLATIEGRGEGYESEEPGSHPSQAQDPTRGNTDQVHGPNRVGKADRLTPYPYCHCLDAATRYYTIPTHKKEAP